MSGEISKLWVFIGAKTNEFSEGMKGVANELKKTEKAFKSFAVVGAKLGAMGKDLTKAITLPLIAIGAGAFKAGSDFDEAMDTIRAGTGATGDALSGLGKSFKSVFTSVPATADEAATAIAGLNTRLGLTGKPLEDLSTQMLNLARVTKSEVGPLISTTTRVFGDWSISTDDQSKSLDGLFKVSQSTGIEIGRLGDLVVQYGAPLRELGFSFDEAAALMGKFDKEGVNLETTMSGLRIALGKMATEGIKDPAEALGVMIQRIKEAGSAGEANKLALEMFGARAGPDMAAAIREGRLELDELLKTLAASPETINQAAEDTMSFAESMGLLRNKTEAALEPLGKKLLDALDRVMPYIERFVAFIARLIEGFTNLSPGWQTFILGALGILAALGPLLVIIANVIDTVRKLGTVFSFLAANPIALVVFAILGLIAAGVWLYKHWDEVKAKAVAIWDAISAFLDTTLGKIVTVLSGPIGVALLIIKHWDDVKVVLVKIWDGLKSAAETVFGAIKSVIEAILAPIDAIISAVKSALDWLGRLAGKSVPTAPPEKPPEEAPRANGMIPRLAAGGLVTRPTLAMVGEAGPEAVIPLSQTLLGQVPPSQSGSGLGIVSQTIIFELDGREVTRRVIREMPGQVRVKLGLN